MGLGLRGIEGEEGRESGLRVEERKQGGHAAL